MCSGRLVFLIRTDVLVFRISDCWFSKELVLVGFSFGFGFPYQSTSDTKVHGLMMLHNGNSALFFPYGLYGPISK